MKDLVSANLVLLLEECTKSSGERVEVLHADPGLHLHDSEILVAEGVADRDEDFMAEKRVGDRVVRQDPAFWHERARIDLPVRHCRRVDGGLELGRRMGRWQSRGLENRREAAI